MQIMKKRLRMPLEKPWMRRMPLEKPWMRNPRRSTRGSMRKRKDHV
jgi:hypothetical protein